MKKLARLAAPNVGSSAQSTTRAATSCLRSARAFVFAADEDFGIAPLEAQAQGTPVIAFGRGGSAETIRGLDAAAPTGVLFAEQTIASIGAAVAQFEASAQRISAAACRANAERFSRQTFNAALLGLCDRCPGAASRPASRLSPAMFAPRNLLKSNATTFDRLLRIADPLVIVVVGWVVYLVYLDSAALPPNYWVALLGAALLSVVVFPETGTVPAEARREPRRGLARA